MRFALIPFSEAGDLVSLMLNIADMKQASFKKLNS
jgi:hypothetical protein